MSTIINNGSYLFPDDFSLDFPCQIDVCRPSTPVCTNYRVLILTTESNLSPNRVTIDDLRIKNDYDLILTHDSDIVEEFNNASFFPYGSTWLNRGSIDHPDGLGEYVERKYESNYSVSFLASWYSIERPGYHLRREVWRRQQEIGIPTDFFTSVKAFEVSPKPLIDGEKDCLFDSMFHIATENQSVENYFTEKIVDCFLSETIPVYWGCPNIGKFFNEDGIILFDSVDDLIHKVNSLTPEYYNSRKSVIEENKNKAKLYANFSERVYTTVSRNYAKTTR